METLQVALGRRSYPIYIGGGLLEQAEELLRPLGVGRWAIVCDDTVAALYGAPLARRTGWPLVTFPAGEGSKSLEEYGRLCRRLPVHVRCSSTAGERAHPGLLLPENGRTSLFRGAGTDGAVSAGDRGIFAAVRRSDRARLSGRKNPLTSAFLAMPPRVCYNKENG